jgi:hypothetical protein
MCLTLSLKVKPLQFTGCKTNFADKQIIEQKKAGEPITDLPAFALG